MTMRPFRPHAASTNGSGQPVRPLPSPITDGGLLPIKTYLTGYTTASPGNVYGDISSGVAVSEANDEYLHPRTALPLDSACWSVPGSTSAGNVGPVHVGRDAIIFDTGCVGFVGTHIFYVMVTPASFTVKPDDFANEPWATADGWSDRLAAGSNEVLLARSAAARAWRGMEDQGPRLPLMPPGVSADEWDYMVRFVIFPGCGCTNRYTMASVQLKVESVDLDSFGPQSISDTPMVGNACASATQISSGGVETTAFGFTAPPCSPQCPTGSLHANVPMSADRPAAEQVLGSLNPMAARESITVDCPSCGTTSVEVPHDIVRMIVQNGCYRLQKENGALPCCDPANPAGADRDSYRIVPDFSSPICAALQQEVVCAPSCCLVVGTMVETSNGLKPVEEVRPGDVLVSMRPVSPIAVIDMPITSPHIRDPWPSDHVFQNSTVTVREVTAGYESSHIVINGSLKLTREHAMPVMHEGVVMYKSVSAIEVGDQVVGSSGSWIYVYSTEESLSMAATISLGTDGGNLYMASGYLVHNSDAGFADSGFDFGGAVGVGSAAGVDEISMLERFTTLRSKIKVEV